MIDKFGHKSMYIMDVLVDIDYYFRTVEISRVSASNIEGVGHTRIPVLQLW